MFGIGFMELVVVAVVVLMFVGPRRLPDLMRQFGRLCVRVRRMSAEVKTTLDNVIRTAEQELDAEQKLKAELSKALPHKGKEPAEQHPPDQSDDQPRQRSAPDRR